MCIKYIYKFTCINTHTLNFLFESNFNLQKNYKNNLKKYPGTLYPDSPALNILPISFINCSLSIYIFSLAIWILHISGSFTPRYFTVHSLRIRTSSHATIINIRQFNIFLIYCPYSNFCQWNQQTSFTAHFPSTTRFNLGQESANHGPQVKAIALPVM